MPAEPIQLTSPAVPTRGPLVQPPVRLGLSRAEAAEYIGVSPRLFDELVKDGRMPQPKLINSRRVWARPMIEKAFAELSEAEHVIPVSNDPWRAQA